MNPEQSAKPVRAEQPLRVALVVGRLDPGGAEKQAVLIAQALRALEAEVRVYCLAQGEHYESALRRLGIPVHHFGRNGLPPVRLIRLVTLLRSFRPHIVQSCHFYTNLYAQGGAVACGALGIGSIRSDVEMNLRTGGAWGPALLRAPTVLIANSETGCKNAVARGIRQSRIKVLSNVIDLDAFDQMSLAPAEDLPPKNDVVVLAVANPRPVKRLDRFLEAVALARRELPGLHAWVAGVGPDQEKVEEHARRLELDSSAFRMLGRRDDVPSVLRQADMLVVSSDHEGFPNVLLEAMAARLPVVTTPAGDAGLVVRRSEAGYEVPFDDVAQMARRIVELARDPVLRHRLGHAGRKYIEQHHSPSALPGSLQRIYAEFARELGREDVG